MGVFKGIFLVLLLILLIPFVQGVVFKDAFWNETSLTLTMDQWTSVPTSDFHAYQGHEETQTWYCNGQAEECRPLWKLVLEDLGIENIVFGWYENLNTQGECEKGLCTSYLTDEEKNILVSDGFSKECDTAQSYPCSGTNTKYTDCFACIQNKVTDCSDGVQLWTDRCIGTCNWGGYISIEPCTGLANWCKSHASEVELENTCAHYKYGLSQDNLNNLFNHTRCWIHVTQASNGGNDFLTNVLIEGEPSTKDDYLSCLIDYNDWQESVNSANQLSPGNKVYFDFEGNDIDIPDAPEDPAERPDPCENITCENYCENSTFYSGVCEKGACVYETEENSTNCFIEVPEDPVNDTCVDCVNVSDIAEQGIAAIEEIKKELLAAAKAVDAEIGGTSVDYSDCLYAVLTESLHLRAIKVDGYAPFKDPIIEYVFEESVKDLVPKTFSEAGFENAVKAVYIPELDKMIEEIRQMNHTEVENVEFVKDVLINFDLLTNYTTDEREKIEQVIVDGNTLKFNTRLVLLAEKGLRVLILGKIDSGMINMLKTLQFANALGSDAESCIHLTNAQVSINYVLSLFMKDIVGNAFYRSDDIKDAVEYLNSAEKFPTIDVEDNFLVTDYFLVKNTFTEPLIVSTLFDVNMKAQPYCSVMENGLGFYDIKSMSREAELMQPGARNTFNLYYITEIEQELDAIPLKNFCPFDCPKQSDKSTRVKLEGDGKGYVFYGENNTIAVKIFPISTEYKNQVCKKKVKIISSGGGGGGGSSRPRNTQPAVLTKPVIGPSLLDKWAGENTPAEEPKPVEPEPIKEPVKESKPEPKKEKHITVFDSVVKTFRNALIRTVLPWLSWFNLF